MTRGIAIVPAVAIIAICGEGQTTRLLIASQVVLSMQLGFAVWPLMRFTGDRTKMGGFVNPPWVKVLGWTTTSVIILHNVKLLLDTFPPEALMSRAARPPAQSAPGGLQRHAKDPQPTARQVLAGPLSSASDLCRARAFFARPAPVSPWRRPPPFS